MLKQQAHRNFKDFEGNHTSIIDIVLSIEISECSISQTVTSVGISIHFNQVS